MYLYFYKKNINDENSLKPLDSDYRIRVCRPTFRSKLNIFWYIINMFSHIKFREYQIINSTGKVISSAKVIGKIYKFPFMTPNSIQIGPCYTIEEERRKGFYQHLLNKILFDYRGKHAYMIVNENNKASINGVTRVGFKMIARGHRNFVRKWLIDEYI